MEWLHVIVRIFVKFRCDSDKCMFVFFLSLLLDQYSDSDLTFYTHLADYPAHYTGIPCIEAAAVSG